MPRNTTWNKNGDKKSGKLDKNNRKRNQKDEEDEGQSKQKQKRNSVAKKLNFDKKNGKSGDDVTTGQSGKKTKVSKDRTVAKFVEDGDEIVFEVEGQSTDFDSELEDNSQRMSSDSESDEDMEDGELKSSNNNATGVVE